VLPAYGKDGHKEQQRSVVVCQVSLEQGQGADTELLIVL
jgi:hypothetical protein